MKIELISSKSVLSKAITTIATSIAKLDEQIHRAACSALAMYKEDGNALQYLTALAKATSTYRVVKEDEGHAKAVWDGRSVRGADLRRWIEDFAGVKWSVAANKGEGGYRASKSIKAVTRGSIDIEKAMATPFFEYSKDTNADPKVWDAVKQATALRDMARTLLEEGATKSGKQVLPEEAMEARAHASALFNSLTEFLKRNGDHANPDNARIIEGEVIRDAVEITKESRKAPAKLDKKAAA